MHVGIQLDMRNPPPWTRRWPAHYSRTLDVVEEAERLGAAQVWLTEHHFFEDGYIPQPLTLAAAIAARTSRIRIGTAVMLAALRKPVHLAEEAAIVDIVSDGRLELGVGAGYRIPEYEAFDVPIAQRFARTEAVVREVIRLWESQTVTPVPVQRPVPLWGGFFGPRGVRFAGEIGAGLVSMDRALPEQAALLDVYRDGLTAGGFDPASARIAVGVNMVLNDDPEAAWPRIAPHLAYMWDSYNRYAVEGTVHPAPPPIDPEEWRRPGGGGTSPRYLDDDAGAAGPSLPRFGVFTPDEAADHVRALTAGLPVTQVFVWASIAGMPDDLVDRHVELSCTELRALLG